MVLINFFYDSLHHLSSFKQIKKIVKRLPRNEAIKKAIIAKAKVILNFLFLVQEINVCYL